MGIQLHRPRPDTDPNRYSARVGRDRYTARQERQDDEGRDLYVVRLRGEEIGTGRTTVQVREVIEAHAAAAGAAELRGVA